MDGSYLLIAIGVVYLFVLVIGCCANFLVCLVIIRSEVLTSSCYWLMFVIAVGDIVQQAGHFYMVFDLLSGIVTVSRETCLYVLAVPLLAYAVSSMGILSIGLDRLIAVRHPMYYQKKRNSAYVATHVTIMLAYGLFVVILAFVDKNDKQVVCFVSEAFSKRGHIVWLSLTMLVDVVTVIVYCVVWRILSGQGGSVHRNHIFNALLIVMFIVVFGWILSGVVKFVVSFYIEYRDDRMVIVELCAGMVIQITISLNLFVYYKSSATFRRAFSSAFGWRPSYVDTSTG